MLEVADLIALSLYLASLELKLGRLLLFLCEFELQGTNFLKLALYQLNSLSLSSVVIVVLRVPDR